MFNRIWRAIVVYNYIKCGLRYGIDQESSVLTGDYENRFYIKTYNFWMNRYINLGLIPVRHETWLACTYDREYYKHVINVKKFTK